MAIGVLANLAITVNTSAQYSEEEKSIVEENLVINDSTYSIQLSYEQTLLAEGVKIKELKEGQWRFYFGNQNLRILANYKEDRLNGTSKHYYENGDLKCTISHCNAQKCGKWTSYYKNGQVQGEILWTENSLPFSVKLFTMRGNLILEKDYDYSIEEVKLDVKSYYKNGSKFETYTLYQPLNELTERIEKLGLKFFVHQTPHWGVLSSDEGEISGVYNRLFNNSSPWVSMEFSNDSLMEVYEQNNPRGAFKPSKFTNGTGEIVHFHHFGDTACVVNYSKGLLNGKVRFYHERNNSHKTGAFSNGLPSGEWLVKSYSGRKKELISFHGKDSTTWTIFGPKNKKLAKYTFKNDVLSGSSYRFNFFGDTTEVFSHKLGLLHGQYLKFLNRKLLRHGEYFMGEQNKDWVTAGQFNDTTHVTSFGTKDVLSYTEAVPKFKFDLSPSIPVPLSSDGFNSNCRPVSEELVLYTKNDYYSELLSTPDSDDVYGSSHFLMKVSETGLILEIVMIKSPSEEILYEAIALIIRNKLMIPEYVFGFPDKSENYSVIEYKRN